jgi:hypothetical protein
MNGVQRGQEVPHDHEQAVKEAKGLGHWTCYLGASHQCLYHSSWLYEGHLHCQTQQEVLTELQKECVRFRCMLIHLAKGV